MSICLSRSPKIKVAFPANESSVGFPSKQSQGRHEIQFKPSLSKALSMRSSTHPYAESLAALLLFLVRAAEWRPEWLLMKLLSLGDTDTVSVIPSAEVTEPDYNWISLATKLGRTETEQKPIDETRNTDRNDSNFPACNFVEYEMIGRAKIPLSCWKDDLSRDPGLILLTWWKCISLEHPKVTCCLRQVFIVARGLTRSSLPTREAKRGKKARIRRVTTSNSGPSADLIYIGQ